MTFVDIVALLFLLFGFIGGLKEGAVKHFFSLLSLLVSLWITGVTYHFVSGVFSFLPGRHWENVAGFLVTLAITSVLLSLLLLPPRKVIEVFWKRGCLSSIVGGILNVFSVAIGLVVFTLVLRTYPVFEWLASALAGSAVITYLAARLTVLRVLLPGEFWGTAGTAVSAFVKMRTL